MKGRVWEKKNIQNKTKLIFDSRTGLYVYLSVSWSTERREFREGSMLNALTFIPVTCLLSFVRTDRYTILCVSEFVFPTGPYAFQQFVLVPGSICCFICLTMDGIYTFYSDSVELVTEGIQQVSPLHSVVMWSSYSNRKRKQKSANHQKWQDSTFTERTFITDTSRKALKLRWDSLKPALHTPTLARLYFPCLHTSVYGTQQFTSNIISTSLNKCLSLFQEALLIGCSTN